VRYLAWRFLPRNQVPTAEPPSDSETYDAIRAIRVLSSG
jgi:hypothetical protein